MLRRALMLSVALVLPLAAQTTSQPRRTAGDHGATGFLPDRLARIDRYVEGLIAAERIPGAVVMLVRDGQVAYHKAWGYRDLGTRAPLRKDDIFRIASQTKAITSLAVMMLWEEGRFGLDDAIGLHLPEFRRHTVLTKFNPADSTYEAEPTQRRITIRQLLTHTAGLDYPMIGSQEFRGIYGKAGVPAGIGTADEVLVDKMKVLATLPLRHQPGERFTYGLSSDLLGYLVEVLSGMPLDRFFRERIFEPLGMRDTWFVLPDDRRSRLVTLHDGASGKVVPTRDPILGYHPDYPARPGTYFSGGAGLSSTTADYARFLQLFLNGGELDGVRLLGRKTVEMMLSDQLPDLPTDFGLGFGLELAANDHRTPQGEGTFSWGGAFATAYWADPEERLIGLIYTNVWNPAAPGLADRVKTLVYAALR
jgi:CubicO group peptidase (beta-lactamase class C family)